MGLKFAVDSRVLIPRQDTETLCEQALTFLRGYTGAEVLDLCTGSGAIAIYNDIAVQCGAAVNLLRKPQAVH